MVKSVEVVNIFPATFPQDVFYVDVLTAMLVDAARQLCGVKLQILASVNSSLTHLWMKSGEAGLYGFPYVIISSSWSLQLLLLFKYSLRQATTQKPGLA